MHSRSQSNNSTGSPTRTTRGNNYSNNNNNNHHVSNRSAVSHPSKKFSADLFKSSQFSRGQYIDQLTEDHLAVKLNYSNHINNSNHINHSNQMSHVSSSSSQISQELPRDDELEATALKQLLDDNLDFLQDLAYDTDSEIQSLVEQCGSAERTFQMQIADLAQNFETNFSKFSKLDARINRIGSSAARIGDRLEVVDIQQKRATDAVGCIKYFLELNNADSKRSDIFTDPNKVHELAHLIKKLSGIAQELDLQSLSKGKMATEIIGSNIENELLEQFSKADAAKDYDQMKEYANTLIEFNGGESVIQRYISTRDMFLSPISLAKDESLATDTSMRRVTDSMLIDNRLDEFYMDIVKTVEQEDDIIGKVFPSPPVVLNHLMRRIFEQRVRMFMELMLNQERDSDPLLYLRTLCMALGKTKSILVHSLKKYSSLGVDFGTLINSVFCSYQDEYIEREISYVVNLFQYMLHEIRTSPDYVSEDGDKDEERAFVLGTVGRMLTATEEAVERAKILSPDDKLAENVERLFQTLIKYLGYDYIDDLLNKASRLPAPADVRFLAGLQSFFSLVATSTSSVLLIQRHFQLVTLPLVSSSVNEYTKCYDVLGALMSLLETKISGGMDSAMQSLLICMDKILAEQKKDDFKFKDEATEYSSDPTKVCQTCVKFVHNVYDTIIDTLDGRNVEIFLEEFGLNVQRLLLTHFKKFKIGKGGLKLMRDLAEYKDSLKLFQIPAVDEACEILGEISKLHLIAPENLKTVIEEGVLSRMDKNEVLAFIRLRNDFKSTWVGKYV